MQTEKSGLTLTQFFLTLNYGRKKNLLSDLHLFLNFIFCGLSLNKFLIKSFYGIDLDLTDFELLCTLFKNSYASYSVFKIDFKHCMKHEINL